MKAAIVLGSPRPDYSSEAGIAISPGMKFWISELLRRAPETRSTCQNALDKCNSRAPVASLQSLRCILYSARHAGAFDDHVAGGKPDVCDMDVKLNKLQEHHHQKAMPKDGPLMSEQSTEVGSNEGRGVDTADTLPPMPPMPPSSTPIRVLI